MLYEYTPFSVSIHQLMDIWIVSTLLAIMNNVAWSIHVHILSGHMFSFLLGDAVMLCLTFWGTSRLS